MRNLLLVLLILCGTLVHAHEGEHVAGESIFDKNYKYRINTVDGHIGHFYVKSSRVSRLANEKLKIEHTIHLDEDAVKTFNIKYDDKTSLIAYEFNTDTLNYYFNFYITDDLLNSSNPGSMVIFNKTNNTFTLANVTLDPLDESAGDDGHEHE